MNRMDANQLSELREKLYSGLLCDVLDYFGYRRQSLRCGFSPVRTDTRVFGYAYPVAAERVDTMVERALVNQCISIDQVQPGDVYFLTTRDDDFDGAVWGEIMSTGVRARGGVGAIINGMLRDTRQVLDMDFPVLARGHLPTTSKGRTEIVAWNVPVCVDGVTVRPGDLIFGDIDGVVFVPADMAERVLDRCLAILERENTTRELIAAGASVEETYMKIGTI